MDVELLVAIYLKFKLHLKFMNDDLFKIYSKFIFI